MIPSHPVYSDEQSWTVSLIIVWQPPEVDRDDLGVVPKPQRGCDVPRCVLPVVYHPIACFSLDKPQAKVGKNTRLLRDHTAVVPCPV